MRTLSRAQACHYMLGQLGLRSIRHHGPGGVRAVLEERRCVQLDPLDAIGTNAELVFLARVDGVQRGQIYDALYPGHAFEHFAKERCILPASAFPAYRDQAVETPWWRSSERMRRLDPEVVAAVLAEVDAHGPLTKGDLTDRGAVERMDWSGWKSTGKAASLALDVLWPQCRIVVSGRVRAGKLWDLPARALPVHAHLPAPESFARWAVLERVEAAGLLSTASGPHWSMLKDVRTSELPQQLVHEGLLEQVQVEGSRRVYLAPSGFMDRQYPEDDGQTRILGPLDPLLWDRKLVHHIFDFEYIWEVYKPKEKRRWGWYVCPVLQDGELVARIEGATVDGLATVQRQWVEDGAAVDSSRLDATLARLGRPR
ncbi:MAG: AlkZ family DNA glycosylase [Proteobacteria bacterium]|nr:AlkZ family DNA glycosylase [Pseudomonadota bacterium]